MYKYKKPQFLKAFSLLRKMMLPNQYKSFIGMFFLILFGTCVEAFSLGLIFPVLAIISGEGSINIKIQSFFSHYFSIELNSNELFTLVLNCLIIAFIFRTLFLAVVSYAQSKYSFSFRAIVAQNLFRRYLNASLPYHLKKNSSELLHTLFIKTGAVTNLNQQVLLVLAESMTIFVLGIMLIVIEPVGALLVIFILLFAGWIFVYFTRSHLTLWAHQLNEVDVQRIKIVQESLGGIRDVKLLGRGEKFLSDFKKCDDSSCRISYLKATLQSLPRLWLEFLAFGSMCIFIYTFLFFNNSSQMILPTLGVFAATAFRIMPSINRLLVGFGSISSTLPIVENLAAEYCSYEILADLPANQGEVLQSIKLNESIEFDNVSYSYDESNSFVIKNLTCKIQVGSCVGFVGESGAGKTTLLNLLLGLYEPTRGRIMADGVDISSHVVSWRELIGFVPQDIFLLDNTLKANIAFGLDEDEVDNLSVNRALKDAQLENFVLNLPHGLDTIVGERGVRISGGQRQRIGIARALYKNPEVLVFDEATSALDNQTESFVMNAVDLMRGKKTVIIVAHRLSTIANCDYVYQISDGKVIKHGTPAQLNLIP
jgi:ABC-type multidrug transport system fused ATPase/permease subunit